MKKRESARAVIIEDNKLLCIFRRKIDDLGNIFEYYVIPGGGIEENETKRDTVLRELKEELDIDQNTWKLSSNNRQFNKGLMKLALKEIANK